MKSWLVAVAALTIATPPAAAEPDAEIIVTGRPLSQTQTDLQACLARNCPPGDDIRTTLAHAENQFIAGDYKDARQTLNKSLDRNRKFKATHPVGVSDLLRAQATVNEHLGEASAYRIGVREMRDTLKQHLPAGDSRALAAELEVGDSRLKMGYPDEASNKYHDVEAYALKTGRPHIAALARLRHLSVLILQAQSNRIDRWRFDKARREIGEFVANPTPGAEQYALLGRLLLTRLDRAMGRQDTTDALIAEFIAQGGADRPVLLHAPSLDRNEAEAARTQAGGSTLNQMQMESVEDRWVDIGFWVNDNGRVENVEILRNRGTTGWADVVLRSIQNRLYVPAKDRDKFFMVERYTLTAHLEYSTGSRIKKRSGILRYERLDLTP